MGRRRARAIWIAAAAPLAIAFSPPAAAADLSPGLWEITLETRVAAEPGFAPEPVRLQQCLSAADARDPSALLGSLANPGARGCSYSDRAYTGNTFRFSMQCAGSFGMKARGEVTFSADTMNGTISATADVAGKNTELDNRISAHRLGGC
ncbi:MAG: DUF3617 domain-containing protein [Burkholderiales bacterium]